jgi:hypothetical protein
MLRTAKLRGSRVRGNREHDSAFVMAVISSVWISEIAAIGIVSTHFYNFPKNGIFSKLLLHGHPIGQVTDNA